MDAAPAAGFLIRAFGDWHRLEDNPIHLQAQPFWNDNAIKQIEKPLDQQREQGCWNRPLKDGYVIVQVKAAQNRLAQASRSDQCRECRGPDIDHGAGLDSG
jgi:hypothetical protein